MYVVNLSEGEFSGPMEALAAHLRHLDGYQSTDKVIQQAESSAKQATNDFFQRMGVGKK
jgi:hypothetical protein